MTDKTTRRALALGSTVAALLCSSLSPVLAQDTAIEGVFALSGADVAVTGRLEVRETGPLTRQIELTYADKTSGRQITHFDVELTQQLHILATDAALTQLIHEHADTIGTDGTFTAELEFPVAGLYHIYTDTIPSGLDQQVMRFEVTVGEAPEVQGISRFEGEDVLSGPLVSSDGLYTVTLDAVRLEAGSESALSLLVEKDGTPAGDLEPYLGVSAHAVFVRAEDLAYVHAHATGEGGGGGHAHGPEAALAPTPDASGHQHDGEDDELGSHAAEPAGTARPGDHHAAPAAPISPRMSLHVTPPAAGSYALWIEFIGGGEVHTVPFRIEVPEAGLHPSH